MFKQKFPALILLFFALVLFTQCKKSKSESVSYHYQFIFLTEEYKPLNYTSNGNLTGLAPEILKNVGQQLSIPFEVSVLPWDQAYTQALQTDNAVLFSTILNTNRKTLFKWAGPVASLDWMFYSSSQNPVILNSLDDAKKIGKIGVIKDYSITQYLLDQGFTNLEYCTTNIDAFERLLKGEIDLFPSDRLTTDAALESLNKSYYSVAERLTIRTDLVYFAFNKKVPDDVVADFQMAIDRLKDNGVLLSLYRKFMNSSDFPGSFQIYTENYPPLTFRDSYGNITGFGSEIAKEIMNRNNIFSGIRLTLWSIGYDLALNNPNIGIFTMDHTPSRDSLFQWVGPLGTNTTYFYTKIGSGISITSLDDAKNLSSVGTVTSWFSDQYLRSIGFTNLVSEGDPAVMTKKLMTGEVDAFVCSCVTFPDILRAAGYQYNQVIPAFTLMSSDYYIAFSKTTSPAVVAQWQSAFVAMKTDGTYDAIYKKWFP
ncbi:MAG: transporter substrate-binding domain-containing protein [Bacteroidota bacterium]|jgi:ABC-type amino acid transport substrate-binding protein